MRHFLLLLRVQILALINSIAPARPDGKQRRTATRFILVLTTGLLLTGLAVIYMIGLGIGLTTAGLTDAIPVFAVLLGSIAGIVFTFMKANGTLFGMADYDLVMSLPFPRRTVVASRMAALFGTATVLGAVLMVPLYGVYFSVIPITATNLTAAVISVLLAPAIPTSLAIFASFALTAIASRFRHANLVYIVFALVAVTAFVVGSYWLSFSVQTGSDADTMRLLTDMGAVAEMLQDGITHAYPPTGLAAEAVTAESMPALLAFTTCSLVIPAICLEIMQRNYLAINGLLASRGGRGRRGAKVALDASKRTSSPFKALVIKELRTQIGIPTYAINCLFGYLLMLVLAIALAVVGARGLLESDVLNTAGLDSDTFALHMVIARLFLLIPWVIAFCTVVSPSAAVAISMEGKNAWLMATAPVPVRTILGAKLASNAIPAVVTVAASTLILLFGGQIDALEALETLVVGLGLFYLAVNIGMLLDARRPNFAWSSAQEVVKRSLPIMACVLGGMVLVFGLGGATMAIAFTVGDMAAHAFAFAAGIISLGVGHVLFRCTCRTAPFQLA